MALTPMEATLTVWGIRLATGFAITYIGAMNNWFFTSMRSKTFKFVVSGNDGFLRVIGGSEDRFFDKDWNFLPKEIQEGVRHPLYKPSNDLFDQAARMIHRFPNIWFVGLWPVVRVKTFKIPKSRLIPQPKKEGGTILDRIETDEKPTLTDELEEFIQRPIPAMKVATSDSFTPNVLATVMVRVTNPVTLMFAITTERLFSLLYSAVVGAIENHTRTRTHEELVREDRGNTSAYARVIRQLNDPGALQPPPTTSVAKTVVPGSEAAPPALPGNTTEMTVERIMSLGIRVTLGIEIYDAWVEQIDEDEKATKPAQKITEAKKKAEARVIEARGEKDALLLEAEGKAALTERLVGIYKDAALARDERVAELQGGNITTSIINRGGNGNTGTSVLLPTTEAPPKKPAPPSESE